MEPTEYVSWPFGMNTVKDRESSSTTWNTVVRSPKRRKTKSAYDQQLSPSRNSLQLGYRGQKLPEFSSALASHGVWASGDASTREWRPIRMG
jgi:hypothetical protein